MVKKGVVFRKALKYSFWANWSMFFQSFSFTRTSVVLNHSYTIIQNSYLFNPNLYLIAFFNNKSTWHDRYPSRYFFQVKRRFPIGKDPLHSFGEAGVQVHEYRNYQKKMKIRTFESPQYFRQLRINNSRWIKSLWWRYPEKRVNEFLG